MAIGRQILSGLFGATAGGLSGFAQQKAEERARMQRQMEREEERAYQRGLVSETRRYQEALAAQEALMRGDIVAARRLAPEPEAEVATPESTAETLKSFITGARMSGAGVGLARGATDAAPFGPLASPDYDAPAISEKDRRDLRSVGGLMAGFRLPDAIVRRPEPLRAEYAKPETTAPERQAIELAGEKYEIVTPAERQARALEAARGGLDAIEVARLREVARGSEASPEREEARAVLSDIGVSYQTEQGAKLQELDALDNFLRTQFPSLSDEDRVQLLLQHNLPRPTGSTGGARRRGDRIDPAIKQIAEHYNAWTPDDLAKLNSESVFAHSSSQQLMTERPALSLLWSTAGALTGDSIDQAYALDLGKVADSAARASEVGVLTNFDIARYRSQVVPQVVDDEYNKRKKFETFKMWANWIANNYEEVENRENLINQGYTQDEVMQLGGSSPEADFYLDEAEKNNPRRAGETEEDYNNRIIDIAVRMMNQTSPR